MQGIVQPLPVRLKCGCCGAEFSLVPDGSLGYDLPLFYLLIPRRKVKLKSLPKLFKSFILPHRSESILCPNCEKGVFEMERLPQKQF